MTAPISKATPPRTAGDIPLVHTLYQLYQTWHELCLKFPKSQRYTLGATCQNYLLTTLEYVLLASSNSDTKIKRTELLRASSKVDVLRLLVRLSKDCKCLSNDQYLSVESQLHEAGRMLGGWLKTLS